MATSWLNYDANVDPDEQDDHQRALARIMSPVPAAQLVAPMQGTSNPPSNPILTSSAPAAQNMADRTMQGTQSATLPNGTNIGTSTPLSPQGANSWMTGMDKATDPSTMSDTSALPTLSAPTMAQPTQQASAQPMQPVGAPQLQPARKHGFWDTFGNILVPGAMQAATTTSLGEQRLAGIAQARAKAQADIEDVTQQTAYRAAQARKQDALADADKSLDITPEMAGGVDHPELAGTTMGQRAYTALATAKQRSDAAKGHDTTKVTTTGMNNATSTANNQNTNNTRTATNAATNTSRETVADAKNKTQTLLQNMRDATSRANNADTNSTHLQTAGGRGAGATPGQPGSFKVPPAVTTRAALGNNVQENTKAAADILARRPDLIGKIGGSESWFEQNLGHDDEDLAQLQQRLDNITKASNGAHQLRGKYAIEATNKLLSQLRNGPNAFRGAFKAMDDSVQTFLDDEKHFQETGNRTGTRPAASAPTAPTPGSHVFNSDTYGAKHTPAETAAAVAYAKKQGYTIKGKVQ